MLGHGREAAADGLGTFRNYLVEIIGVLASVDGKIFKNRHKSNTVDQQPHILRQSLYVMCAILCSECKVM